MIKSGERVHIDVAAGVMRVRLPSEIDHHSAVRVRRLIDEAICAHRPTELRLDACEVAFMDSSGLGLLMGRLALMRKLGGRLVLCHPTASVLRIVRLAGMERMIAIET
jgi:stage II sporulation protein AA (anti-sigma F factor antagonist)